MSEFFFNAAKTGSLNGLRIAIERNGVDVNLQEANTDYTALAYAAEYGHTDCVNYLLSRPDIVTDIEVYESQDSIGGIPLHLAAFRGHLQIIRSLVIKSPLDMHTLEYCGYTPLHETVLGRKLAAFKLLLRLGADPDIVTGADQAAIDVPENLTTFELIIHRSRTPERDDNGVYAEMLAFLTRWQLRKKILLTGENLNAADEEGYFADSDSDNDYVDDDIDDENEDPQSTMPGVDTAVVDSDSVNKALHKKKDVRIISRFQREIDRKYKPGDNDFTDSDSEEEWAYTPKEPTSIDFTGENLPVGTQLVAHARGHHFYTNHSGGYRGRRAYVEAGKNGSLRAWGMYSADTHRRAGVAFNVSGPHSTAETECALQAASVQTGKAVQTFADAKNQSAVLQRRGTASRETYTDRLIELIQRYVNSYRTLLDDITQANDPHNRARQNERTQTKQTFLQRLRDNPFVSTSQDIGCALDYAFAIINYEKKTTHTPYPHLSNITLGPAYQADGTLKHPYLGVVFITLHTPEVLEASSHSIEALFARNEIDTSKGPGTHETSGYIRSLERVFVGGITGEHICLAKAVRVPNLYHPYRRFILQKYGITDKQYTRWQRALANSGAIIANPPGMRNMQQFDRVQQEIIQHVIDHERQQLIAQLQQWAQAQGLNIGSMNDQGDFSLALDLDIKARVAGLTARRAGAKQG